MPTAISPSQDAIRTFFTQQCAAMTEMMSQLAEPQLSQFKKLKAQYDSVLASMPITEQVPAAMEASHQLQNVFSVLQSNQSLLSYLSGEITSMTKKVADCTAAATAAGQRCSEFEARIKAGELVEKTAVTELCSASKTAGIAEGEGKVRAEVEAANKVSQTVAARKTQLAAEKLPMPAVDAILAVDEPAFVAAKAKASERADVLKKKGFALNSAIVSEVAWASDADYTAKLAFIEGVMKDRALPGAGFITAPNLEINADIPRGAY